MAEIWNGYNDTTNSDVLGSYTGNPADSDKRPEQDSDDLEKACKPYIYMVL